MKCICPTPAGGAGILLRLAIGVLFFSAGVGKFMSPDGAASVSQGIVSQFDGTWLPGFMVAPYAYVLPYLEVLLGVALILGIRTRCALFVAGLLLISLAFGMAVQKQHATAANNFNYVLMAAVGYYCVGKDNAYSLDVWLPKCSCEKRDACDT